MQVVIMGCGRTGVALATRLDGEGDKVTVIDEHPATQAALPKHYGGRFLSGNATSRRVLEEAEVGHSEGFVALTADDSANAVASRMSRDHFRVPKVLARLNDPAHGPIFQELGIMTVGPVQLTANRVVELLRHPALEPRQSFGSGETVLVHSSLPDYLAGRHVSELNVPGEIQVVEVTRGGHSRIPDSSTEIAEGDFASFIVASASLRRLESFVNGRWS
jgi:trk system potassium uptake protein